MRKRLLFFTLLFLVIALAAWIYLPVLTRYREIRFQEEEITQKIETLDKQILEMQEERERLKNDLTYIEKVIRDELGLVGPGETVYRFVSEKVSPPKSEVLVPSSPTTEEQT